MDTAEEEIRRPKLRMTQRVQLGAARKGLHIIMSAAPCLVLVICGQVDARFAIWASRCFSIGSLS